MSVLDTAVRTATVDAQAVVAMQSSEGTLEVWPGCRHCLTLAEAAVVASPPFQRLRRLRQMGLAFHVWPNAENTRASHSLGVSYWAATSLAALERCPDAATQVILAREREALAPLSLDVVLRLFALLHDIDLLPLGHTLRYQSAAFAEGSGRTRLAACVAALKANTRDHAFRDAPSATDRESWHAAFEAHLDAAADALAGATPGLARLLNELVNSGLGADLMDFALRDSAAINRQQSRHDALAEQLRLVETIDGCGWRSSSARRRTLARVSPRPPTCTALASRYSLPRCSTRSSSPPTQCSTSCSAVSGRCAAPHCCRNHACSRSVTTN